MKTKVTLEFDTPEEAALFVKLLRPEIAVIEDELPLLPLVVGGVYERGDGSIETIISQDEHDIYPFNGEWDSYTREGALNIHFKNHKHDLIKRIR